MINPLELAVPLIGAGLAALSSALKSWLSRNANSEIRIDLGNGTKIVVDGSAESREKIRTYLSDELERKQKD